MAKKYKGYLREILKKYEKPEEEEESLIVPPIDTVKLLPKKKQLEIYRKALEEKEELSDDELVNLYELEIHLMLSKVIPPLIPPPPPIIDKMDNERLLKIYARAKAREDAGELTPQEDEYMDYLVDVMVQRDLLDDADEVLDIAEEYYDEKNVVKKKVEKDIIEDESKYKSLYESYVNMDPKKIIDIVLTGVYNQMDKIERKSLIDAILNRWDIEIPTKNEVGRYTILDFWKDRKWCEVCFKQFVENYLGLDPTKTNQKEVIDWFKDKIKGEYILPSFDELPTKEPDVVHTILSKTKYWILNKYRDDIEAIVAETEQDPLKKAQQLLDAYIRNWSLIPDEALGKGELPFGYKSMREFRSDFYRIFTSEPYNLDEAVVSDLWERYGAKLQFPPVDALPLPNDVKDMITKAEEEGKDNVYYLLFAVEKLHNYLKRPIKPIDLVPIIEKITGERPYFNTLMDYYNSDAVAPFTESYRRDRLKQHLLNMIQNADTPEDRKNMIEKLTGIYVYDNYRLIPGIEDIFLEDEYLDYDLVQNTLYYVLNSVQTEEEAAIRDTLRKKKIADIKKELETDILSVPIVEEQVNDIGKKYLVQYRDIVRKLARTPTADEIYQGIPGITKYEAKAVFLYNKNLELKKKKTRIDDLSLNELKERAKTLLEGLESYKPGDDKYKLNRIVEELMTIENRAHTYYGKSVLPKNNKIKFPALSDEPIPLNDVYVYSRGIFPSDWLREEDFEAINNFISRKYRLPSLEELTDIFKDADKAKTVYELYEDGTIPPQMAAGIPDDLIEKIARAKGYTDEEMRLVLKAWHDRNAFPLDAVEQEVLRRKKEQERYREYVADLTSMQPSDVLKAMIQHTIVVNSDDAKLLEALTNKAKDINSQKSLYSRALESIDLQVQELNELIDVVKNPNAASAKQLMRVINELGLPTEVVADKQGYTSMDKNTLLEICHDRGIGCSAEMSKPAIINALVEHDIKEEENILKMEMLEDVESNIDRFNLADLYLVYLSAQEPDVIKKAVKDLADKLKLDEGAENEQEVEDTSKMLTNYNTLWDSFSASQLNKILTDIFEEEGVAVKRSKFAMLEELQKNVDKIDSSLLKEIMARHDVEVPIILPDDKPSNIVSKFNDVYRKKILERIQLYKGRFKSIDRMVRQLERDSDYIQGEIKRLLRDNEKKDYCKDACAINFRNYNMRGVRVATREKARPPQKPNVFVALSDIKKYWVDELEKRIDEFKKEHGRDPDYAEITHMEPTVDEILQGEKEEGARDEETMKKIAVVAFMNYAKDAGTYAAEYEMAKIGPEIGIEFPPLATYPYNPDEKYRASRLRTWLRMAIKPTDIANWDNQTLADFIGYDYELCGFDRPLDEKYVTEEAQEQWVKEELDKWAKNYRNDTGSEPSKSEYKKKEREKWAQIKKHPIKHMPTKKSRYYEEFRENLEACAIAKAKVIQGMAYQYVEPKTMILELPDVVKVEPSEEMETLQKEIQEREEKIGELVDKLRNRQKQVEQANKILDDMYKDLADKEKKIKALEENLTNTILDEIFSPEAVKQLKEYRKDVNRIKREIKKLTPPDDEQLMKKKKAELVEEIKTLYEKAEEFANKSRRVCFLQDEWDYFKDSIQLNLLETRNMLEDMESGKMAVSDVEEETLLKELEDRLNILKQTMEYINTVEKVGNDAVMCTIPEMRFLRGMNKDEIELEIKRRNFESGMR